MFTPKGSGQNDLILVAMLSIKEYASSGTSVLYWGQSLKFSSMMASTPESISVCASAMAFRSISSLLPRYAALPGMGSRWTMPMTIFFLKNSCFIVCLLLCRIFRGLPQALTSRILSSKVMARVSLPPTVAGSYRIW